MEIAESGFFDLPREATEVRSVTKGPTPEGADAPSVTPEGGGTRPGSHLPNLKEGLI